MVDRAGQQLGNYRLVSLLGRGGFAEVYLGEHLRLGTHAAVKILYTRLASKDDMEGFEKEARTIAHLKHPHIVHVLDYDVEDDTPFLVMDYAPGSTLRNRHPKGTILPLTTIIPYVKQVTDALQYAHDLRVIHRDVKPENMLIGEHNELLLSDFGIAIVAQSSRYLGTQDMAGTIAYMAPEQIQAHPRPASDQYSLAVTVYEWLSGTRPFHGSYNEIAVKHIMVSPPSLREKVPMISPDVEQVVMTALAKDPKQRFVSVKAFATALEQASQADVTPSAKPVVQPSRTRIPPDISLTLPTTPPPSPKLPEADVKPVGTVIYTYRGHSDWVTSVAWSPDGQRIASASYDRTVQVWDAVDGGQVYTYRGHSNAQYGVATMVWSPDGQRIASAGDDPMVQVWEATTGAILLTYRGHSKIVRSVAWSPDGQRIASGADDETVQVWDAVNGSLVYTYTGHSSFLLTAAWSPDGQRIASSDTANTVQVWQAV